MNRFNQQMTIVALLIFSLLLPTLAQAIDFNRIVVLGASLSDPGNAFTLTGQAIKPHHSELDDFLVPSSPYAIGGHHCSNSATLIEQLALRIGQNQDMGPAYNPSKHGAFNFAVGGALYVVDISANDVRDALGSGSLAQAEFNLGAPLDSIDNA